MVLVMSDRLHKILLVEDDDVDVEFFRRSVSEDWWVESVGTVEGAIDRLRSTEDWDVVVMDLGLPGCSGLEAIGRLAEWCAGIPILVMTGSEDPVIQLKALKLGASDCIWKGVERKWIRQSLDRALEWEDLRGRLESYGISSERRDV